MTHSTRLTSALLIALIAFSSFGVTAVSAKEKVSIKLTAPSSKSSFAKEGSGIIPIAWKATNVPEDALIILELDAKKLAKGSVLGGGTWQGEVAAGDSEGSYNWDIEGEGRPDAGTYRVRALVQACADDACTSKGKKTYAKSKWVNITVTKSARNESDEATDTVGTRPMGQVGVSLTTNGSSADAVTIDASSAPSFNYYPSGDVESCTMTAYYQGGKRSLTHGWKNGVKSGDYGRFSFAAVGEYPLKSIQSVEVVCGNAKYRATDTVRFTVNGSVDTAAYKILIGKTGKSTFKKGTGTMETAQSYCKQAYNDPEIHKNTRVQCYFDGDRFEDVKAFKG